MIRSYHLIVCLALTLASATAGWAADADVKEVRQTLPFARDGRVSIHTYKGSIDVKTWDSAQVEIYARVEPDGFGGGWKEKIQDTEIRIDASADSVRIESDYKKVERRSFDFWNFFDGNDGTLPLVHYKIKVPRNAIVRIKDYKSKTEVTGLNSDLDIDTYKGTVAVSGLDGSLVLNTYKGEARAQFANLARRSRFKTYKGEIEILLPRDKGFDLDAEIGRRGSLDSAFEVRMARGKSFHGSINGGGPALHLDGYRGTFRLRRAL